MEISYRVIRSNRKNLSLEINEKGLTIRAPKRATAAEINSFLIKNEKWILKNLEKYKKRQEKYIGIERLTEQELNELADRALKYIPERVKCFFGSISSK